MSRLRVLCLHGFTSSGARLQRQLAPVAAALEPYATFTFVDAPFPASPGYAWWRAKDIDGKTAYDGWPAARAALHALCAQHGPFDGVLGFSQGAILTWVLVALRPEFALDFAVMVGGFAPRDAQLKQLFEGREFDTPSLHVWGTGDDIVPASASEKLSDMFKDPSRIVHE